MCVCTFPYDPVNSCSQMLIFTVLQEREKESNSHWTLGICSRWKPWNQNTRCSLFPNTFAFNALKAVVFGDAERAWEMNFKNIFDPVFLKKTQRQEHSLTAFHTSSLLGSSEVFLITTVLQQCIFHSLNHVFRLWEVSSMHVSVTGPSWISYGILTEDIWCRGALSNQMVFPLLFQNQLQDQRWQHMGAANDMLT